MESSSLNEPSLWQHLLPRLDAQTHKYKRGHAFIFSGNLTNTGAARLAAMSAARCGAGLVTVLSPPDALLVHASHLTSIMLRETRVIKDALDQIEKRHATAVLIGPAYGLGIKTQNDCISLLKKSTAASLVLDADALSCFEGAPDHLFDTIHSSEILTILTPHDGEFSRLFPDLARDHKLTKVQRTQIAAARAGAYVVYKGAQTIIARPDGRYCYNENGTPLLATAGSGDVLAGMITGLLAQNMPAFEACSAAVWLHCDAAKKFGAGLIAEDLPRLLPASLAEFLSG